MDKKEASFILANIDRRVCDDELNEALDVAIKALEQEPKTDSWSIKDVADTFKKHGLIREQEPCEDAISRAEAVRVASGYCHPANIANELAKLPPVTPQPKTGHWIPIQEIIGVDKEGNEISATVGYKCSKCLIVHPHTSIFCPSCGAKMVEPQERSE